MSRARRVAVPIGAGVAVAAVVFAVVLLATRGEDRSSSAPTPTPAAVAAGKPDPTGGRLVFAQQGCGSCHRLAAAGSNGQIGPPLDQVLANHTPQSLAAKIQDPGQGSIMPQDFGQRMSFAELQALVDFLVAARDAGGTR